MLTVGSVVIGAEDVERAARFWMHALDYEQRYPVETTWAGLRPRNGAGPNVSIQLSETPAEDRPRIHLDLYAGDSAGVQQEVSRLLVLGATRPSWDYPDGADFVVMADTEGNKFCVINTGADGLEDE